jgi:hypothetical protein
VGEGRGRVLYRSLAYRLHLDVEPSSFYLFGVGGRICRGPRSTAPSMPVGVSGATGRTAMGAMSTGRCAAMVVDHRGVLCRRWGTERRSVWLEIVGVQHEVGSRARDAHGKLWGAAHRSVAVLSTRRRRGGGSGGSNPLSVLLA